MGNYECYGTVKPVKLEATATLPERECYDFYEGSTSRKSTEDEEAFLQDALLNKDQLFRWAQIASQIFKSESDSCWNHSGKSWDKNFGKDANYMDLIECLCHKHDRTGGSDVYKSTGLMLASSLSEVEKATGQLAQDLLNRKLKADDFIKRCNLSPFHDNTDSQTVFYTLAGHLDRYGGTFQFGYTVFGLAFYNYRLKVISDGTPYNTAIGNRTVEEAISEGGIPGFTYKNTGSGETILYPAENRNNEEASQTVTTSVELSKTESNSIANAKEFSFTEMVGVTLELEDILKISKIAMEMQFTAGQVLSTAYTKEQSATKTKSTSSSVTVTLPPHTAIMVKQKEDNTTTTLKYDCPVMVQFDVAVFSICGTCYDDKAAVHTFSTAGYDQRSFITMFQPSKSGNAGDDGSENLYLRTKNYNIVSGYEKMHGVTQLKSHNKGMLREELNWDTILKQEKASTNYKRNSEKQAAETKKPQELVNLICQNRPMAPTGGILTESGKSIVSIIEKAIPLYALHTLRLQTGSVSYDVGIGDALYPNNWIVEGYDAKNVPFYGFDSKKGTWILVDEHGTELRDDSIACISHEALTNEPFIEGKQSGTIYAKYLIPDNYYTCQTGTPITNESIQTVFVKISIHDTKLKGSITASGTVKAKNHTVTNLETLNTLNVHVYDETGKEIIVPVIWEAEPGFGNNIMIMHNQMSVSAVGNYHIRARYEDLVSDWIDVVVTE